MKKTLIAVVSTVLICCCVFGGTLAWLTDKTNAIENTFTVGDINITLTESDDLDLKIVPGTTITKDPVVTVSADSEACWLFVKVEEANWSTKLTYVIGDGWSALDGVDGVYCRKVEASNEDQAFAVIKNDTVTIADSLTKTEIGDMKTNAPKLTITAYAVQAEKMDDANAAWTAGAFTN